MKDKVKRLFLIHSFFFGLFHSEVQANSLFQGAFSEAAFRRAQVELGNLIPSKQRGCFEKNKGQCPSFERAIFLLGVLYKELSTKKFIDPSSSLSNRSESALLALKNDFFEHPINQETELEEDVVPVSLRAVLEDSTGLRESFNFSSQEQISFDQRESDGELIEEEDRVPAAYAFFWEGARLPVSFQVRQQFQFLEAFTQDPLSSRQEEDLEIHLQSSSRFINLSSSQGSEERPQILEGWVELHSPQHTPVWLWVGEKDKNIQVPLVSRDLMELLLSLAKKEGWIGLEQASHQGFVYGWVDSRDELSLKQLAQANPSVLYYRAQLQPICGADIDRLVKPEILFFLIPSLQPGGHFLLLESRLFPGSFDKFPVTLGVPVLAGKGTFLNLTDRHEYQVTGRLRSLSSPHRNYFGSSFVVKPVGEEEQAWTVSSTGDFSGVVHSVGSYPVFLDIFRLRRRFSIEGDDAEPSLWSRVTRIFRHQIPLTRLREGLNLSILDARELKAWGLNMTKPCVYHDFSRFLGPDAGEIFWEEQVLQSRNDRGDFFTVPEAYVVPPPTDESERASLREASQEPVSGSEAHEGVAVLSPNETITRTVLRSPSGEALLAPVIHIHQPQVITFFE